ncbi:MAG: ABC transporter ATP-binding protein/permease [Planctomycetota bacterium]
MSVARPVEASRVSAVAGARPTVQAAGLCQRAGGTPLLHGISFTLRAGELVAILGPSGAGKSLLIELLAGAARPAGGSLRLFGRDDQAVRARVGYVPQGEVVHEALTVREALVSTLRLRAPALAASATLLEARLARVADRLGLAHRLGTRIQRMSGGERRRVSLALELVTDPDLLILDEVTSGLDAAAERRVMETLRQLADEGLTIVCTTHTLETAHLFDRALVLQGGRLVFDGAPAAAVRRFGLERLPDLYARLAERPAEAWEAERRPEAAAAAGFAAEPAAALRARVELPGPRGLYQLPTLVARQLKVTARDGLGLLLILVQAPIIAALVAFAYDAGTPRGRAETGFKLAISAIWLGCISTCQDLVKERAIYRRERLAGLSPHAYLVAKLGVGLLLVSAQALLLVGALYALQPLSEPPLVVGGLLCCAAAAGGALGLLISSAVSTRTAAVGLTPLVLVPQILFVGTLEPLRGLAAQVGRLMPSHWANEGVRAVLLDGAGFPLGEAALLGCFALVFSLVAWGLLQARDTLSPNCARSGS